MTTDELHELARLYGIQLTYEDAGGTKRTASRESLEAILRARIGHDDLRDALRRRREEVARRTEPVRVVWGAQEIGYHEEGARAVFAAPSRAPRPNGKSWGIFTPLYAAHTEHTWGIGDLADLGAYRDWIRELGGSVVATLPLLPVFDDDPSPYSPISRLFWNELYLDVRALPEYRGEELPPLPIGKTVDYAAVSRARRELLAKLAERFEGEVEEDVRDYARFRGDEQVEAYVQHRLREQMRNQPSLYLDFPLGVSPRGYDAQRYSDHFAKGVSVGAPPDLFFTKGQNWDFRPLDPDAIRERQHDYFRRCIRHHCEHAGMLRIDHVMGLHRLFWIPEGAEPKDGVYVRYPAEELYAILLIEASRTGTVLVGEDLGTVPRYVPQMMKKRGLRRMHVIQYELKPDDVQPAGAAPAESVASINTHDMPTFAGFWSGADIDDRVEQELLDERGAADERDKRERMRCALMHLLTARGLLHGSGEQDVLQAALELLAAGDAEVVLVNLEDLWLEREPQNRPGVAGRSWRGRHRLSLEEAKRDEAVTRILSAVNRQRREGNGDTKERHDRR